MNDSNPRTTRIESRLAERGGSIEFLRIPAAMFGAAVTLRRAAYDRRFLPVTRLDVPVISVGNLTTGGTGKTPFTAWLVRELSHRGLRPGVLARGYRSEPGQTLNDEGRLLARLCPGVLQVQDKDRVRGGARLVELGAGAIVLDDGFQHRRLQRDLDIVLVDAMQPWGLPPPPRGGSPVRALLPRGLLREPPSSLARADLVVITRAMPEREREVASLAAEIGTLAPGRPIVRADHRARTLSDATGARRPIADLAGRTVDLVSGIGNPAAFEASVAATGAHVRAHRIFPDHHAYARRDLEGLGRDGAWVVTTAKDAVKLDAFGVALHAFEIELEISSGRAVVDALLDAVPHGQRALERAALHEGLHG